MSKGKVAPPAPAPQPAQKSNVSALELAGKLPIRHHDVSCAISKAQAARELLDLAYEHFDDEEGDTLSWARSICFDAIDEALKDAQAAYVKVATEKPAAEVTR